MDWLAPHFNARELAAVDICRGEVFKHQRADAKLRAIFDRRMHSLEVVPPDIGHLPAWIVTPNSQIEVPAPGSRLLSFSYLFVCRFAYPRNLPAAHGEAGLASLFGHVANVMTAPNARLLPVRIGSSTYELVTRSVPSEGFSLQPLPVDERSPHSIWDATMRWEYEATLTAVRELWNRYIAAGGS